VEQGDEPEYAVTFRIAAAPFTLASWTDSALVHYSGTAVYERDIKLPAVKPDVRKGERIMLDLGAVGLAAEVWVNGKSAGSRAWRPFHFDITGLVRSGDNRLRIRVANADAGWQAQGDTIYPRGSWGLKFTTERDRLATLRPNGLEGPVRILTTAE
jgi:beta-galactosidase/beta-glucuronidase